MSHVKNAAKIVAGAGASLNRMHPKDAAATFQTQGCHLLVMERVKFAESRFKSMNKSEIAERAKLWIKKLFGIKPPCNHVWHPAVAVLCAWGEEEKPIKHCTICGDWQPMSDEQFYSVFGEHFYAYAKRKEAQ